MGFLDVLIGKRKLAGPAPDRLFAISTAYVKFQTELGITTRGTAAIVFQPLATADFDSIVSEMEEVVKATSADSGTTVETSDDSYGFRWLVLRGSDFDDLVVGVNAVSGALEAGGYGERVLCAVFAFEDRRKRPLYWIYNYKRGAYYPFAPSGPGGAGGEGQRDTEHELVLKAQVGTELPVEQELERWFPLWGIPI
jgi:PspA associated protein B